MLIIDFFKWWYQKGLIDFIRRNNLIIFKVIDFFSVDILFKTLFQPFKLIDSDKKANDFPTLLSNFVDKLISRMIGFFIRLFTIIFSFVPLTVCLIYYLASFIIWLILPISPIIFVGLFLIGDKIW